MLAGAVMLGFAIVIHVMSADGHWAGLISFGLGGAICMLIGIVRACES